ncbi:DUF374 domain-containing protein [Candidatus Babeliales bacterium]|nr:DUF374 domain-containing protein [Candidatus Babeliales bacterium]
MKQKKFKNFFKKIKSNNFLNYITKNLIYFFIRALFLTYRLKVEHGKNLLNFTDNTYGVFYFWHQNIIAATFFFFKIKETGHCIISPSKDGKIMGFIASKMGFTVLYGSAHKQPIQLIRQSLNILKKEKRLCLVGDGSRGPAFKLQEGVIYFAKKSNLPLIFIDCKNSKFISIKKSWDKFQIPLPFSKIYIKVKFENIK